MRPKVLRKVSGGLIRKRATQLPNERLLDEERLVIRETSRDDLDDRLQALSADILDEPGLLTVAAIREVLQLPRAASLAVVELLVAVTQQFAPAPGVVSAPGWAAVACGAMRFQLPVVAVLGPVVQPATVSMS